MSTAAYILIIILSVVLAIFLIVGIVVLIFIAKLIKSVRRIVDKAEHVVESATAAAEVLRNASGPLAFFKLMRNIMRAVEKMHKQEK